MARNFWKEKAKYENFYASDVKLDLFAQSGLKLLKSLKDLSVCFTALIFFNSREPWFSTSFMLCWY